MSNCTVDMSAYPDYYVDRGDSSIGCWATNYVLAPAIVLYIAAVLPRRKAPLLLEHTRMFFTLKYAFLAVSVLVAGFVHQGVFARAGDNKDGANVALWGIVLATLVLSGACTTCCALSLLTKFDNTLRNAIIYTVTALVGMAASVWVVSLPSGSFAIAGVLGEALPYLALVFAIVVAAWSCCGGRVDVPKEDAASFVRGAVISLLGVAVIFAGAFIQVGLSSTCGVSCPVDCPLPAPAFNHNALFHVLQTVGMAVLAVGMDKVCGGLEVARLRTHTREVSEKTQAQVESDIL
eukprot:TRINITY_DN25794_c0_g4_i1.p1 TRINITY_DN25794_c0_g4~~TRINITY_DN25794_c0_g4_i1.p1  ORF type:complete len:292 (+),score=52.30 TRINITY_DN25794_c0_g4_i1:76-951(+)